MYRITLKIIVNTAKKKIVLRYLIYIHCKKYDPFKKNLLKNSQNGYYTTFELVKLCFDNISKLILII